MIEHEKVRILVIDDNKADLVMAKFLISNEGWEPIILDNQTKYQQILKDQPANLILLDLDMPGLSGLDILKRIKKENSYISKIPVIMLSGHSSLNDVKSAINLGAVDYIVKPIDPQFFGDKIKKHLTQTLPVKGNKKNKEWVEYIIPESEQPEVNLNMDMRLVAIGEMSLRVHNSFPLPAGATVTIRIRELEVLELGTIPVQIAGSVDKGAYFEISCNIVGLGEKDLQKIRLFCQTYWSKNRLSMS